MLKKYFFSFLLASIIFMAIPMPKAAAVYINPDVSYVLNSDDGKYLNDQKWCAAQGNAQSWAYAIGHCNTGSGVIPAFDKSTSSYVVLRKNLVNQVADPDYPYVAQHSQYFKKNVFQVIVASAGKKLVFYKNPDGQYYITSLDPIYSATLTAEPNDDPDYKYNWTGSYANNQYSTAYLGVTTPASFSGYKGFVIGNDIYSGQVGAVNVGYSDSWDVGKFTDHVPYAPDDTASACGVFDIPCYMTKIVGSLSSSFQNFIIAVFKGLATIFVPDTAQIKTKFDDLTSSLNSHLGFIAYPFTFLGNFFSAFTNNSGFCSTSSCTKNFGNLFGHPYTVNLTQLKTTAPTFYTMATLFLQGTLVVALIFSIKREFNKTTEK